nr:hypothetical protein [Gilliamella apicola]
MFFSKRTQGHLIALMTVFLWGTTFIATKVLLTDFKPIEILFFSIWTWLSNPLDLITALFGLAGG